LRTRRPHFSASSVVCDAARIECLLWRARYQAGNSTLPYVLFALPGGMKTARRWIEPRETPMSRDINNR
jgi:hypothetical protein